MCRQINDFAGFLHRNPDVRKEWEVLMQTEQDYRMKLIRDPAGVTKMNIVYRDLEKLEND